MGYLNLCAILGVEAHSLVRVDKGGQGGRYTFPQIGITAVSIDAGEISSKINWGIHGTEVDISPDILLHVKAFAIDAHVPPCDKGRYVLRGKANRILAEANVDCGPGSTSAAVHIRGKSRQDVVKLYEQICASETAPEAAGGRKGLIRGLHGVVESLTQMAEDLARQVGVLEGREEVMSEYRANLEKQVQDLRAENVELNNPKISAWKFFWRAFFGTNDPSVA